MFLENIKLESWNQLPGTIPRGLGSLSFLAYISVVHNQFKGVIPQATQITGQPKSSFKGNVGLCGLLLEQNCFTPPTRQPTEEDEKEEEEDVLNWKAVVIGYWPGLLFGLLLAHVIASYRTKWFIKIVGPNKHKETDPGTLFMSMDSRWDSFNYKSNKDSHMYVRSGLTGLCSLCSL